MKRFTQPGFDPCANCGERSHCEHITDPDFTILCGQAEMYKQLAEYEELGLKPQEVKDILELFHSYRHICGEMPPDRFRELVEADREGRCVMLPVSTPTMAYTVNPQNGIISTGFYPTPGSVLHDTERGYAIAKTREAAEAALRGEQHENQT